MSCKSCCSLDRVPEDAELVKVVPEEVTIIEGEVDKLPLQNEGTDGNSIEGNEVNGEQRQDSLTVPQNEDETPVVYKELDDRNYNALRHAISKSKRMQHDEEEEHGHHGHKTKPHSIVNALISGFINYLLMFGLCCAYGMIMFPEEFMSPHAPLGVKLNLLTAFIAGLVCATQSKVSVAIGGPDLNPVVFIGLFVSTVSEGIADKVGLKEYHDEAIGRRLSDDSIFELVRRLGGGGGGSGSSFCSDGWKGGAYKDECEEYHERLRATAIFATAVSSAILGLIYFCLGRFKVTRLVSYVPTSVQEAFLSCIGYKVFKYALKFCRYKPLMFMPAAVIGVVLYFLKANHIGNPAVVIPTMVLVPLAIFYAVVLPAGLDIESMRTPYASDEWMFPKLEHVNFWVLWTDSYGKADMITIGAWVKTLPDLAIMIIVCTIDCLLKISSTESKLPIKVDKDYEAQLYGLTNIATTLTGSSVGYMQLKFNVINFGVLGNTTDRRGGIVYAILCGACFFGTIGHFNFLPRFFLGILLFFAGAGFVAENLWGSRKYLNVSEWCEILIILAVFIFSGSLVAAVIVGGLVTCVSLIMKYTKIPCIAGHPLKGGDMTSSLERRNPLLVGQLNHVADTWFVVVRLKGFIFFASAQRMTARIMKLITERESLPSYRRLRYVVLDCELLDGMDASAGKSIRKLLGDAANREVTILWSSANHALQKDLMTKEMMKAKEHGFRLLADAVTYIEEAIIEYQSKIQQQWLKVNSMFKLQHNICRFDDDQDPWGAVLLKLTARRGCPWKYCNTINIKKCKTILWTPGELDKGLFLVHSGKVALYSSLPDMELEDAEWPSPVAIYGYGWFLNREFIVGKPSKLYAIAIEKGQILSWSQYQWWMMFSQRPVMAAEIMRAVHYQSTVDLGSLRWIAQSQVDENAEEEKAVLKAMSGIDEEDIKIDASVSLQAAMHYSDKHRAALPEQLKMLIDSFEVAEAFGKMGAYDTLEKDLVPLHKLPDSIIDDLRVSFETNSVVENGEAMLPSEKAMAALSYAGIPRVPIAFSTQESFTREEFMDLGHHAAMARLPVSLDKRLREIVADHRKKHDISHLHPHQVANILRATFHRSFSVELVQGLVDEIGADHMPDDEMFLVIFSRLLRWHEQHWNLLVAIKESASPSKKDSQETVMVDTFTAEALSKLLPEGHEDPLELASEMMWAGDWPRREASSGKHWGAHLHVYDVALLILTQLWPPEGKLLPPPCIAIAGSKPRFSQGHQAATPRAKKDMGKLIVHLPSLPIHKPEFNRLSSKQARTSCLFAEDFETEGDSLAVESKMTKSLSDMEKEGPLSLRAKIAITLEDPASSQTANLVSLFMGILILISIGTMFLQPVVQHGREDAITEGEKDAWFAIELVLTVIFTVEYIVRVAVANALGTQTTMGFILTPANVCDFFAIIPFYVDAIVGADAQELRLLRVVRLLRLTRIARIGRLANRNPLFPPITVVLLVIWFIYMKSGLSDGK